MPIQNMQRIMPGPMLGEGMPFQGHIGNAGGFMSGYTGPAVGSPEWKAARAAGQRPVIDWMRSQYPQWGRPADQARPFANQSFGYGRPPGAMK